MDHFKINNNKNRRKGRKNRRKGKTTKRHDKWMCFKLNKVALSVEAPYVFALQNRSKRTLNLMGEKGREKLRCSRECWACERKWILIGSRRGYGSFEWLFFYEMIIEDVDKMNRGRTGLMSHATDVIIARLFTQICTVKAPSSEASKNGYLPRKL
jgi:hypothetical protein